MQTNRLNGLVEKFGIFDFKFGMEFRHYEQNSPKIPTKSVTIEKIAITSDKNSETHFHRGKF